jgi:hypothetical protein
MRLRCYCLAMRRIERIALHAKELRWEPLGKVLPAALEALGLVADDEATDGEITLRDLGEDGCIVQMGHSALARRAACAIATRAGVNLMVYEVVGSAGEKRNRFRTQAHKATAKGELKPAEGKELDLEDEGQKWGGGSLADQAERVLEEFAQLAGGQVRALSLGFKKRPAGRPSTPRVSTLLGYLQKSRHHEAHPQPDGRVELRIELAAGGKQTSFCTAKEHEELLRLLGGAKK